MQTPTIDHNRKEGRRPLSRHVLLFFVAVVGSCDTSGRSTDSARMELPANPVDRYSQALSGAMTAVDSRGEITAYLRRQPRDQVPLLVQRLTREGVTQLSDQDLQRRLSLFGEALLQADKAVCAAVGHRTATGEQYAALIGSLSDDKLHGWAEITVRGILGVVRAVSDAGVMPESQPEVLAELVESNLTNDDAARFQEVRTQDPASISDDDACWYLSTIYITAAVLEGADGGRARSLVATAEALSPAGAAALR